MLLSFADFFLCSYLGLRKEDFRRTRKVVPWKVERIVGSTYELDARKNDGRISASMRTWSNRVGACER